MSSGHIIFGNMFRVAHDNNNVSRLISRKRKLWSTMVSKYKSLSIIPNFLRSCYNIWIKFRLSYFTSSFFFFYDYYKIPIQLRALVLKKKRRPIIKKKASTWRQHIKLIRVSLYSKQATLHKTGPSWYDIHKLWNNASGRKKMQKIWYVICINIYSHLLYIREKE